MLHYQNQQLNENIEFDCKQLLSLQSKPFTFFAIIINIFFKNNQHNQFHLK